MDTMESMVGELDTWILDTWWRTHTWWGAHIHGRQPTYMVAWLALLGGQVGTESHQLLEMGSRGYLEPLKCWNFIILTSKKASQLMNNHDYDI